MSVKIIIRLARNYRTVLVCNVLVRLTTERRSLLARPNHVGMPFFYFVKKYLETPFFSRFITVPRCVTEKPVSHRWFSRLFSPGTFRFHRNFTITGEKKLCINRVNLIHAPHIVTHPRHRCSYHIFHTIQRLRGKSIVNSYCVASERRYCRRTRNPFQLLHIVFHVLLT